MRILIFAGLLFAATGIQAQPLVPPCSAIAKSTKLTADCVAPMTIDKNGVVVDLNGHSVLPAELTPNTDNFRRVHISANEVTVKNGTITGENCGVIVFGKEARLQNLTVGVAPYDDSQPSVEIIGSNNELVGLTVDTCFECAGINFFGNGTIVKRNTVTAADSAGLRIYGNGNLILENQISSSDLCTENRGKWRSQEFL